MKSIVSILHSDNPDDSDLSLAKLFQFLGIETRFICLNDHQSDPNYLVKDIAENGTCLALGCGTLVKICANKAIAEDFKSFLTRKLSHLIVYGICPGIAQNEALEYLTDGTIRSVLSFDNNDFEYEISAGFREICQQFSGLSFGPINHQVDFAFAIGRQKTDIDCIININKQPFFLRTKSGTCEIFFWANHQILDIHSSSFAPIKTRDCFSKIIPPMMFLKYVFKDRCWHSDVPQACFIIDDPLLRETYGFLNFRLLLEAMDNHDFSASIAFIPWNFKRTNRRVANLFKERADRLSLCVHGCDHTRNEFASTDYNEIDHKVKLATKRMRFHESITGLTFDKVMVFPQGITSMASIKALKSNNYWAALYCQINPTDRQNGPQICGFLEPALMNYETFPLLTRRSPKWIPDFALDLFVGKPIMIYGHHDSVKEGYARLAEFVKCINSLDEHIKWTSLGYIAKRSYWWKREGHDTVKIKLYASNSLVHNTFDKVNNYSVVKDETSNVPIRAVLVNGKEVPYQIEKGQLKMNIEVQPKQCAEVEIVYQDISPGQKECGGMGTNTKVLVRRYLSEIRDNYIAKNRLLSSISRKLEQLGRLGSRI